MAAPISGAPTLTTTDSADEPGMKRTRLNEAFDALSQVRLRARSRRCSPGWPMLTLSYAALVVCLAQALACPPAHGDASAPKAPSGAGAPLPNTSASADHYRFPLTREPNFIYQPPALCALAQREQEPPLLTQQTYPITPSPRTPDGGSCPSCQRPSSRREVSRSRRGPTAPRHHQAQATRQALRASIQTSNKSAGPIAMPRAGRRTDL